MAIIYAALIALTSQQVLSFPGGGSSELCKALFEKTQLPVACLVYDQKPIKPFTLKWLEAKDLDRLMWPVGKHHLIRKEKSLGLYRGGMPSLIIDGDDRYLSKLRPFLIPEDAVKDGFISLQTTDKTVLRIASLARLKLSKPLRVHWLYQRLAVAVSAKGVSESQFLAMVATAIGAKFSQNSDEYQLDLDPQAYRVRSIESLSGPRPIGYPKYRWGERYSLAVSNLGIETLRAITDAQLEKVFETNNGSVSFLVTPGTALHRAVLQKVDAVEELSQEKDPSFRQVADAYIILLNTIDLSKQPRVVFGPPAQFGALLRSIDNPETWVAL